MYQVERVNYNYYYSNKIPKSLFEEFLVGSECTYEGELKLQLKPGNKFLHYGPYIIPAIRWIDSFENNAEFEVLCDVKQVL